MRIALDAMGGDHAPRETIRGAQAGLKHLSDGDQLVLFGPEDVVRGQCSEIGLDDPRIEIVHCSEVIDMHDSPVEALRQKRDSTIARLAQQAGKGEVDAIISAGNTGAFVAACQLRLRPIKGVSRPGIAVVLPSFHGPVVVCDVGANVTPKSHHLHEYARMAALYSQYILHVEKPRVGLVSIGEEDAKGNTLVKEARQMIKGDPAVEFVGNMEGRDIFAGNADVYICDGFVGNVVLKLTEGLAEGLFRTIISEIKAENEDLAEAFAPIVDRIWKKHDFAEYGGAPLLGVNTIAIICHGRSDARAISNAIRVAEEYDHANLNQVIAQRLALHQDEKESA